MYLCSMGIVFRQSVKTAIVTFSGAILGALTIWLSTKYIQDKQQFGFTKTLTQQALTASQILLLGLSGTLFVYSHRFEKEKRKQKLLLTVCLGLPLIFTLISTIAFFVLKGRILSQFQPEDQKLMATYFSWLPVYTVLFIYSIILEQYLATHMKVAVSAFMREILLRLLNIVVILLFAFNYISFHTLVLSSILIYIVPILAYLILCFSTKEFGFTFDFKLFSKEEYKEIGHFAWYHFLLSISIILMSYLDLLLLPVYDKSGLVSVAVYSVAGFIISFLQLPSKAFLPATFSILTKAFNDNDQAKAKDIFVRSSLNILIPTIGIGILLACNLDNAVSIIGNGKNYAGITGVVLIMMVGQLINLSTGINDQVLSITKYYKFTFYLSLFLTAILFFLLRWLVPVYGVYGAAWSTTITIGVYNIAKYVFIYIKLNMQPYTKSTLGVLLAGSPAIAAGFFFPHFFKEVHHMYLGSFADAAIRSFIILAIYVAMLLWLKPSNDLNQYVLSIKKNKRLF